MSPTVFKEAYHKSNEVTLLKSYILCSVVNFHLNVTENNQYFTEVILEKEFAMSKLTSSHLVSTSIGGVACFNMLRNELSSFRN